MGRQVTAALALEPGMSPVAYVDGLAKSSSLDGLQVFDDAGACFAVTKPDVVIDFTNANWTPGLSEAALTAGTRLVIGTTGLSGEFLTQLEEQARARKLGVVVAANFAIGAVLMMHFARQAARFFDNAEIIELHHDPRK